MGFKVEDLGKKFGPGDPMGRDRFSMGQQIGNNIMVLFRNFGDVTDFEVVDMKTGQTLHIEIN